MRKTTLVAPILFVAVVLTTGSAGAQQAAPAPPPLPPYGAPISLDLAKKVMAGAEAEARKNNWAMVIAIVDSGGNLVMLERMDNAPLGSVDVAQQKAHTANAFKRPTKVFQDAVAQGGVNLRLLAVRNATPLEGAVPIIVGGAMVGAVGVSGGLSAQDAQCAQAGADLVK